MLLMIRSLIRALRAANWGTSMFGGGFRGLAMILGVLRIPGLEKCLVERVRVE
jgi:hypothetical protein